MTFAPDAAPVCPDCGSPMVVRTARRGNNAGSQFWGCTRYPQCRTIVPIVSTGPAPDTGDAPTVEAPKHRHDWYEVAVDPQWECIYTLGGGSLRSSNEITNSLNNESPSLMLRLQQTFIAISPPTPKLADQAITQVVGTFRKILQRGDSPPLDPDSERKLLTTVGAAYVAETDDTNDLALSANLVLTDVDILAAAK